MINEVAKEFIESHIDMIDKDDWEQFYIEAYDFLNEEDVGNITESLLSCGIDPLKSLDYVPDCFLFGSNITTLVIPSNIIKIGASAFHNCKKLRYVTMSQNISFIDEDAFNSCTELRIVTLLPNTLDRIGPYAFYNCKNLKQIVIPNSVTFIQNYAFSGCTEATIYCEAPRRPGSWSDEWNLDGGKIVWNHNKGGC